jgi:hypothetical protein
MKKILILFLFTVFVSCSYPEMVRNEIIYENSFEEGLDLSAIDGYSTMKFNNTTVLGNFNNDNFSLNLKNIGNHDYIIVSFDLYVHGSWDGNANGFENNDKPDLWTIELKPEMDLYSDYNKYSTTFSNSPCFSNYCLRQSYPQSYPFDNTPTLGSDKRNLPTVCESSFFGGETTLYRIEKTFKSSGNAIVISFYDELYQPNAIDKDGNTQQKCDESWSIDNIKIRAISYK